jgi:small subunit ribosomal protein S20
VKVVPIIESAKKRVRQNEKKKKVNDRWKNKLKNVIKEFEAAIDEGNIEEAEEMMPDVYKIIDKSASHNIIHKNNAARKKSKMKRMLNELKNNK